MSKTDLESRTAALLQKLFLNMLSESQFVSEVCSERLVRSCIFIHENNQKSMLIKFVTQYVKCNDLINILLLTAS